MIASSGRSYQAATLQASSAGAEKPTAQLKTPSPPAVVRALTILEEVANSRRGLFLPDISSRLQLPKSSAHSLVVALERAGYLQRDERTRRYMLGSKVFGLANFALAVTALRQKSYPVMESLMKRTNLRVQIAVMDHDQAVFMELISPPLVRASAAWPGKRLDLHCTAVGKALAAYEPEERLKRLLTEHTFARHNANTISSTEGFLLELDKTRERGYAIDDEEFDLGNRCLAAAILDPSGHAVGAISIAGSTTDIHQDNIGTLSGQVVDAAKKIERALRGQRPSTPQRA
jgi:DNA-binding IclR family transcriptional regulator